MTTNFVNPSYPNHDSSTGDCIFALILQPNVCQVKEHLHTIKLKDLNTSYVQVRVDFVDTSLLLPDNGVCSQQKLTVTGDIWPLGVSSWCGVNSDQHFYIETVRPETPTDQRQVVFSVNTQVGVVW